MVRDGPEESVVDENHSKNTKHVFQNKQTPI